jgi:spastin
MQTCIYIYTRIYRELDEAVLRRLVKRIYVPLPDELARAGLIQHLMRKQGSGGGGIIEDEAKLNTVVQMTGGYSGSDLSAVCHEAAMGPIRELGPAALLAVKVSCCLNVLKCSVHYLCP